MSKIMCLHKLFELQVDKKPDLIALVYQNNKITYRELNNLSNQLAYYLQSCGIGPNKFVGVLLERSIDLIIGLLAVLKSGGAYLPLDPSYPEKRLEFMLEDSQVSVLLTQEIFKNKLERNINKIVCLDSDWNFVSQNKNTNPGSGTRPENLAYLIYTSGSTGKPKGVMMPHSAVYNHMMWMQFEFPLTEKDKILQKTSFSFDASVWEIFAPLIVGAQLYLADSNHQQDPAYIVDMIIKNNITTIQFVPSLLQMILERKEFSNCLSLRNVFCGGERLTCSLIKKFKKSLDIPLHNLYGPTEACIDATFWTCDPDYTDNKVPIGKPISNVEIYILDKKQQKVSDCDQGEIYIGGKGLGLGYLNNPELTKRKFINNPYDNDIQSKLYKTGDLGRFLPDGNIEYLGRIDHQVKIRGFRIELGEIESVLLSHPFINSAAVQIQEVRNGIKQLVAYLVSNKVSTPSIFEMRAFAGIYLPDYMIPHTFVFLDKFPITENGKLDRNALPLPDMVISDTEYVPPHSELEEKLVQIWKQVLGMDKVGVNDNFFVLGGDSILAAQILMRIESGINVDLSLAELYEFPTIAGLGLQIEKKIIKQKEQEEKALTDLLEQIENMSEDEVISQLSAEN